MSITRLLTGRNFTPEAVAILGQTFERALRDLEIANSDEDSRDELAKLIIEIASAKTDLDVEDLLDQVKVAWASRHGGGK